MQNRGLKLNIYINPKNFEIIYNPNISDIDIKELEYIHIYDNFYVAPDVDIYEQFIIIKTESIDYYGSYNGYEDFNIDCTKLIKQYNFKKQLQELIDG